MCYNYFMFKVTDNYYKIIFLNLLIVLIILIGIYCLGNNLIWDIDVSTNFVNDEVYYWKQIQSIYSNGSPIGYYGYNESHALIGGFGSWNPLIIYAYAFFAFIFGNNINSIHCANILLLLISFNIIAYILDYNLKKIIPLLLPYCSLLIIRYTYSGMVEILFIAGVMLLVVLKEKGYLKSSFILCLILASLRVYLVAFIPYVLINIDNIKIKDIIKSLFYIISLVIFYFIIQYFFTAPFLYSLTKIDTVLNWLDGGIINLIRYIYYCFVDLLNLYILINTRFINSNSFGIILFLIFILFLIISLFINRKNKSYIYNSLFCLLLAICSLIILITFYYNTQNGRHILTFASFVWTYLLLHNKSKIVLLSLSSLILFTNIEFAKETYYHYTNNSRYSSLDHRRNLNNLQGIDNPSSMYDNTLLVDPFDSMNITYFIDSKIAINICLNTYLSKNAHNLKSKYILLSAGNSLTKLYDDIYEVYVENDYYKIYINN